MRNYDCLPRMCFSCGTVVLETVQDEHIESIRQWRNSQLDVLRQSHPITFEGQISYYETNIWPSLSSSHPKNILLSIVDAGELIGYGGLVHISWGDRRAEVSFLLDPKLSNNKVILERYFTIYLGLVKNLAFNGLGLERLTTETYAVREEHIRILEANGFLREGRMRNHVYIHGRHVDSLIHGCLRLQYENATSGANEQVRSNTTPQILPNVLVSCAGRKIPLVRAVMEASRRLSPEIKVWAGDSDPAAPSGLIADGFLVLPKIESLNISMLRDIFISNRIGTIIPTRDGELSFWAEFAQYFHDYGIEVIVSAVEAIKISLDKKLFSEFGGLKALPIIPVLESPEGFGSFVVKEQFGSGSASIGLNLDAGAAVRHAENLEFPIFQPYIKGDESSVDAWFDKNHKLKGLILRRRERIVNGESVVTTTYRDESLEAQCRLVLESMNLRGPIVAQIIRDAEGQCHVIEVNARFGGASTASIAAGLDVWFWSLYEAGGGDVSDLPYNRINGEIRLVRANYDIYLNDSSF